MQKTARPTQSVSRKPREQVFSLNGVPIIIYNILDATGGICAILVPRMISQEVASALFSFPRRAIAAMILAALSVSPSTRASAQSPDIPAWLQKHVGTGDGQTAPVVLTRPRALHQQKRR